MAWALGQRSLNGLGTRSEVIKWLGTRSEVIKWLGQRSKWMQPMRKKNTQPIITPVWRIFDQPHLYITEPIEIQENCDVKTTPCLWRIHVIACRSTDLINVLYCMYCFMMHNFKIVKYFDILCHLKHFGNNLWLFIIRRGILSWEAFSFGHTLVMPYIAIKLNLPFV